MKELNFLPRSFVEARRRRRILRMQSLVILAVLAALTVWFTTGQMIASRLEGQTRYARGQEQLLGRQIGQMQDLQRRQADLLSRQEVQRRLGNWVPRSGALLLISRVLPERVGLIDLHMVTRNAAGTAGRAPGLGEARLAARSRTPLRAAGESPSEAKHTELILTGIAPSDVHSALVVAEMEDDGAFADVRLVYSRHRLAGERILREFQVRCRLVEKQTERPGE